VPGVIAELGARGTRAAVVISAGLGEQGASGRALQRATLDAARPHLLPWSVPTASGSWSRQSGSMRVSRTSRRWPAT
jgi:acetyltransferase